MFLDAIALARTLPCLADPGKIIVIGKPSRPLDDVIPFMATLPGVIAFNPDQCTLTFRRQPGFISLQGHEVCITQVRDLEEGLGLLAALTNSINAVWERRAQLVGAGTPRHSPGPLDIWRLLPQTNCRECGEQTCMAFAAGLLQHKRLVTECPVLLADVNFAHQRATLGDIL